MATWSEFTAAEPEFARQVREHFAIERSETLATLRRDGSPRISGADAVFSGGDLTIDTLLGSVRAADLRKDPRLALHSPTSTSFNDDSSDWPGDAKIAGYGVELGLDSYSPDMEPSLGFRIHVTEVVRTYFDQADHLVIESWHEGRGLRRRERWYPSELRAEDYLYWERKNEA